MIRKVKGLEAPVSLKGEGSALSFAPAEIKDPIPLLRAKRHELPVHEIVWCKRAGAGERTAIVRQDLIFVEKGEHAGNGFPPMFNHKNPALILENLRERLKIVIAVNRRTQVSYTFGINGIEIAQAIFVHDRSKTVLLALTDHPSLLSGNARKIGFLVGIDFAQKRYVEIVAFEAFSLAPVGDWSCTVFERVAAKLDVANLEFSR